MVVADDGATLHEVLIDGTARLYVDPRTKFIVKSVTSGTPEGV